MRKYTIILLFLCFFDLSLTSAGIHYGVIDLEVNPILNWFLKNWGLPGLIIAKISFSIMAIGMMTFWVKRGLVTKVVPPAKLKKYYQATIFLYLFILIGTSCVKTFAL